MHPHQLLRQAESGVHDWYHRDIRFRPPSVAVLVHHVWIGNGFAALRARNNRNVGDENIASISSRDAIVQWPGGATGEIPEGVILRVA